MKVARGRAPLALAASLAVLFGPACTGSERDRSPSRPDGGLALGEPCDVSEDCRSTLCLRIGPGARSVCTDACGDGSECPEAPNWACVLPAGFPHAVCGCVPDSNSEVCGDGLDNDCDGAADDCRLCFGEAVAEDDPRHCGACGRTCRADQRCRHGECVCADPGAVECSGACVDLETDARSCGECGTACGPDRTCSSGTCECPDASLPDYCPSVGCVDLTADEAHCGGCGNACPGDNVCDEGTCVCPTAGETWCGDAAGCVDTTSHEAHCGGCRASCDGGQVCLAGVCACPASWPDRCGGVCVDTSDDASNCGGCGNVCPSGTVCSSGSCRCPIAGWERCGGTCVDVRTDESNCGTCGTACVAGEVCSFGSCTCPSGLYCGGACVSASDPSNCGACGNACGSSQYCSAGTCRCSSSALTACGTACFDTRSDTSNCGGCGVTCRATEVCVSGSCRCPSGQTFCASAGACVSTATDASHCGTCDNACQATEVCSSASCRCPSSGELFCASVGACTDTRSSTSHCGACDHACRATEVCSSGTCRCPSTGELFCDSVGGCVDVVTTEAHCGACDTPCPSDATCESRVCTCSDPALTACPGEPACVDLQTDASHCGGCAAACASGEVCAEGACTCPPPIGAAEVRLTDNATHDVAVEAATDGSRLAIVWRRDGLGWFELLEGDGTPVGGTLREIGTEGATKGSTLDIVWNGAEWVVYYVEGGHVFQQRYAAAGAPTGSPVDLTASAGSLLLTGQFWVAFSPVSGYAAASLGNFQSLGMDGLTPGPRFVLTSGPDRVALAGSPTTGKWGLLEWFWSYEPVFYEFEADGTLDSSPTTLSPRPYVDFNEPDMSLTHDGVTWLAAFRHEGSSGSTYFDEVHLRRGPRLETEVVVRRADRLDDLDDGRIHRVTVHTRGGQAVVSWTESIRGTLQRYVYTRRYTVPSSAAAAPEPVDAPFRFVPSFSVLRTGHHVLWTGPGRYAGVWTDNRHTQWELYAVAADVSVCP